VPRSTEGLQLSAVGDRALIRIRRRHGFDDPLTWLRQPLALGGIRGNRCDGVGWIAPALLQRHPDSGRWRRKISAVVFGFRAIELDLGPASVEGRGFSVAGKRRPWSSIWQATEHRDRPPDDIHPLRCGFAPLDNDTDGNG
jgi:hypothetical protein